MNLGWCRYNVLNLHGILQIHSSVIYTVCILSHYTTTHSATGTTAAVVAAAAAATTQTMAVKALSTVNSDQAKLSEYQLW